MRNVRVKTSIAKYMGEFVADESDGGFIKGTQWLVWKFESDSTLNDAMQVCSVYFVIMLQAVLSCVLLPCNIPIVISAF